ncbi:hypothetical protein KKH39_00965 [Patescibacteria group bacterium]|nr:hypothetical protein [Patescibacteria group bacterium]
MIHYELRNPLLGRWFVTTLILALVTTLIPTLHFQPTSSYSLILPQITPDWLIWPLNLALFVATLVWLITNRFSVWIAGAYNHWLYHLLWLAMAKVVWLLFGPVLSLNTLMITSFVVVFTLITYLAIRKIGQDIYWHLPTVFVVYLMALRLMHDVSLLGWGKPLTLLSKQTILLWTCLKVVSLPILGLLALVYIASGLYLFGQKIKNSWDNNLDESEEIIGLFMLLIGIMIFLIIFELPYQIKEHLIKPTWHWLFPDYSY